MHGFDKTGTKHYQKNLLEWYHKNKRDLPWRRTGDPYKIWVSEIMLQQTQVIKVIPYFENFIKIFPNLKSLAESDQTILLKAWEGLGYYARARNMQKAAQKIINDFDTFPQIYEDIKSLPGIGPYTAAAIASIAFNLDYAVIDGNVNRVLARLFRIEIDPKSTDGKKYFSELADALLAKGKASDYNQAIMELGALVCTPKNTQCESCPLKSMCSSFDKNEQDKFPIKSPKKEKPHKTIAIGIIFKDDKILIAKRPENGMLGGLWEFPGGKQEKNETLQETVVREIKEELDINVKVDKFFHKVNHTYSHFSITLHAFFCSFISGKPKAIACTEWLWVSKNEIENYPFPMANKKILQKLQSE